MLAQFRQVQRDICQSRIQPLRFCSRLLEQLLSGDEFYSPSISKIVIKSFINNVKNTSVSDIAKKHQLTSREKEILKLYVEGCTNNEIAEKLNLSVFTIKTHKNNIMQKYNFKSTVEMIKFALRNNIVEW